MTDTQLAALITALVTAAGAIAGAIRWAVLRMVKAQDDATAAMLDHAKAMTDNAAASRELVNDVKDAISRIDVIADFIEEETSGVHDREDLRRKLKRAQREKRERAKTPPLGSGYRPPQRPKTDTDT